MTVTRNGQISKRKLTITAAARCLGVSRTHLSLVLNGHRQSKILTTRWLALRAARKTL